jgi:hypothetical protein
MLSSYIYVYIFLTFQINFILTMKCIVVKQENIYLHPGVQSVLKSHCYYMFSVVKRHCHKIYLYHSRLPVLTLYYKTTEKHQNYFL